MFPLQEKLITLDKEKFNLLFSQNDLKNAAKTLGQSLNENYYSIKAQEPIVAISILEQSVIFFADLQKNFTFRMIPEFILHKDVCGQNCEEMNFDKLHFEVLKGKNVLLVLSWLDQKSILPFLVDRINSIGPQSLQVAVLICQPGIKCNPINVKTYIAFSCSTQELVGYGFGIKEKLSALPQVYTKAGIEKPL